MALRTVLKRRRRRRKYKKKYSLEEVLKRAKKLLPIMVPSLDLELNYYVDAVEPQAFEVLNSLGISGEAREHLLGYVKKAISIGLRLGGETLLNELEALKEEYVLRGFNRYVLDALDEAIFEKVAIRRGVYEGMKYVLVSTIKSAKLALKYVAKALLPRVLVLAKVGASVGTVFRPPFYNKLPRSLFGLIVRPSMPSITLISSFSTLPITRSVTDVKKPFPSFRLVIRPRRPSPSIVASNYPSVEVRKSP